jgi:outer membrane protein assembly factor BamB
MLKNNLLWKKTNASKAHTVAKVAFIASLMILSAIVTSFVGFENAFASTTQSTANSDVMQYEWPQHYYDAALTHNSPGTAPNSVNVLWQRNITANSALSAFNGKIFVNDGVNIWAFNPFTGAAIWNKTSPTGSWGSTYANYATKIDSQHMILRYSNTSAGPNRVQWICVDPETGNTLWYSQPTTIGPEDTYYADYKVWITGSYDKYGNPANYTCWDFSDISEPPTVLWTYHIEGAGGIHHAISCGDGKVMIGSYNPFITCLDAKTGKLLWETPIIGESTYPGYYYQGKFYAGTAAGLMYCFDPDTGDVLWTFSAGGLAEYAGWGGAGNGLIYHCFSDSYLYALDPETGSVVWKYKEPGSGLYYPEGLAVADGKVYCQTGQASFRDWDTGEYGKDVFTCLDGKTGAVIWRLDEHIASTTSQFIIAYGNLYGRYATGELTAIGSSTSWSQFHNDAARTGQGSSGPTNLELAWEFDTDGAITSSPCAENGKVYFGSMDKNVYCLNATSGDSVWTFSTGQRIYSSPAVTNGKVYTGPDDGYVYCLDANNGTKLWATNCGYAEVFEQGKPLLRSSPCVVSGLLYVGSTDGYFYCLDAGSGSIEWKFNAGVPILSSPAVDNGMVYVASQNGTLYKLNAISGDLMWTILLNPVVVNSGGLQLKSTPTVADGRLFIGNAYSFTGSTGRVYCINASTGAFEWNYTTSSAVQTLGSPAYANGLVYFADQFNLVCANATNGEVIWKQWLVRELLTSPIYATGKIYMSSTSRVLYALNATTGDKLSWVSLDAEVISTPALYEGRLYIGDWGVSLYCFKEAAQLGTTYYGWPSTSPSVSPTPTVLPSSTPDASPAPSVSQTPSDSATPTATPPVSSTPTVTSTPSASSSPSVSSTPPDSSKEESTNDVYLVAIAAVVIAIIAVVAVALVLKKRRK